MQDLALKGRDGWMNEAQMLDIGRNSWRALAQSNSGHVAPNRVAWKDLPRPDWKVIYKKHDLINGVDGPRRPRSRSRGRY